MLPTSTDHHLPGLSCPQPSPALRLASKAPEWARDPSPPQNDKTQAPCGHGSQEEPWVRTRVWSLKTTSQTQLTRLSADMGCLHTGSLLHRFATCPAGTLNQYSIGHGFWFLMSKYLNGKCFQGGSVVKNPPANAGDLGSILGSGRSPEMENVYPLQYSCLGNPMDRGASVDWQATVHGVTKQLDMI